jgi:hypothetical protein
MIDPGSDIESESVKGSGIRHAHRSKMSVNCLIFGRGDQDSNQTTQGFQIGGRGPAISDAADGV